LTVNEESLLQQLNDYHKQMLINFHHLFIFHSFELNQLPGVDG